MQKVTVFVGILAMTGIWAGCQRSGDSTASADIRYRVFEAPAVVVDNVIPTANRMPIADSPYSIAHTTPTALASLLKESLTDSGLLSDHSRTISWWPKTADTWAYSRADGKLLGGGGGAGFLGVRTKTGLREVRIEYDVTHTINTAEPLQAKVTYEGAVPADGVLLALSPFERTDGTAVVHLIAFEIENWR